MLDIKWVRSNPDKLREIIKLKGIDSEKANVDKFLTLDEQRISLIKSLEELNQKRNEISGRMKSITDSAERDKLIADGKSLKENSAEIEQKLNEIEKDWMSVQLWFPNLIHPDMPVGKDSSENVEVKAWRPDEGYLPKEKLGLAEKSGESMPNSVVSYNSEKFELKDHVEICENLGLIDLKQSAIVSGSRFSYIVGDLARLQFSIEQFITRELFARGFEKIIPPVLVKERALFGSSHFPGDADQIYSLTSEKLEDASSKLYLLGSSETSNFAYYMDRNVDFSKGDRKMFANTQCFRSEVGSWGKDVRGLKRVHQFDKLELDVVCLPENSDKIFDELISINEWLLQNLKIPYHIINMCTGDAGYYATAKKYDWEAWLPSQNTFMELGSCTNAWDYQARRYNFKFKNKSGEMEYPHTVNDTGVAFGRMLIAIVDNYQTADGKIKVPDCLVEFMGKEIIG